MPDSQANKAVVRRFLGAIASGDVDLIEALQAPDCDWWVIGGGEISRKSYTDQVKAMLLAADVRKVDIIGMIAEDDTVTCEVRSEIHFGDRIYRNEYHDLFRLRDGLIVHGHEYFDTGKVAAFFGSGPTIDGEAIVRDFLALFHTEKLDGAALRDFLADAARYQPVVPLAPMRHGADAIVAELERQYLLYDECACDILNVAGRVTYWREYWDALDCAGQLGIDDKTMRALMGVGE